MRKDYNLEKRKFVIGGSIILIVFIYIVRLAELQLGDSSYKESADSNAFVSKSVFPSRGLIYDRYGRLVVYNRPTYDLMMVPKDVEPFDTLDFCNTLQITKEELEHRFQEIKSHQYYSSNQEQLLISRLSQEVYGALQEKLFRFPGFSITQRIMREYNYNVAANVLGDIREVNQEDLNRDTTGYYSPGDLTGDMGVEKSYEQFLRGKKGKEVLIRDVVGRIQGHYNDGANDVQPVAGNNLRLSIDIDLQAYGEKLMKGKLGAIVAIEPSSGEVLALVTSPSYDPALLVDKDRGKNYYDLTVNALRPLLNRAIQGAYPPGSTFKPTQGLTFLQEGIITPYTCYPCNRGYNNGMHLGCHGHASPLNLVPALGTSCNAFFCWGFKHMIDNRKRYKSLEQSFDTWKDYLVSMGYGHKLGIDLPGESRGFIPNFKYYDRHLKGRWAANTVISISIGQGEVLATPLQIANLAATIANRGYFYTPHVVKHIEGVGIYKRFTERHYTKVKEQHYLQIVEGMRRAVTSGTCRKAEIAGMEVCGKTGTAQNPHGRDHSAFMGFAPKNNPKIAVAVYVENGGFGAEYGVPIGRLMMEKYINGKTARPDLEGAMMGSSTISYGAYKKK